MSSAGLTRGVNRRTGPTCYGLLSTEESLPLGANAGTTDTMANRNGPPPRSRLHRGHTSAFARRQRKGEEASSDDGGDDGDADKSDKADKADTTDKAAAATDPLQAIAAASFAIPVPEMGATVGPAPLPGVPPASEAPPPPAAAPAASPIPAPPNAATVVAPISVDGLPILPLMPPPSEVPEGDPDDPAAPPGQVPPGDSRSMRRRATEGEEFVLVYRVANIVVSRWGPVGRRGQWRVVEYPTTTYASNAYARECSRWVSEGFSDYRGP